MFGKTPKLPGQPDEAQQMIALVQVSSEENSLDGAANGGISAGGHYSKGLSDTGTNQALIPELQPETANVYKNEELLVEASRGSGTAAMRYNNDRKNDDSDGVVNFEGQNQEA